MNELNNIEKFLKELTFKKQIIGGVSESDVLKKIQNLSALYTEAFKNQEIRYQAIINEKEKELERLRRNSNE